MTKRIYIAILSVSLIIIAASIVIIIGVFNNYFDDQSKEDLENKAAYIIQGLTLEGEKYFAGFEISADHVVWLSADGKVLYDNMAYVSDNENYQDYEVIKQAFDKGKGQSILESSDKYQKTLYYAQQLSDGTVLFVSGLQHSFLSLLQGMLQPIAAVLFITLLLAGFLARYQARKIIRPINEMDLEQPGKNIIYSELTPLVEKIQRQNQVISEQMEQLLVDNQDRENMRREFTANVSHELKTPLTSISGTAEILKSGIVKTEDIAHFAGNIYQEAQRLIVLVSDILKLSQMEEEDASDVVEKENVDIYEIAVDTIDWLKDAADKRQVSFVISGNHAIVYGVRQIIEEMLYNLCDNAIKYNREGGKVRIVINEQQSIVKVIIADTGIGIAPEHQNRVFERFYRVDKSHSRELGGTGLGLSIVKHGAAINNAIVKLDSEPGKGTTITLLFEPEAIYLD